MITKFIIGEKKGYHYRIGYDSKGIMVFYKSDLPANGNLLIVKCRLDYNELEAAVKFCYAFASDKNGCYPTMWIDPAIANSYYEGLFTYAFDDYPAHIVKNVLEVMGDQNSVKNTVIAYARGSDYFKQPVTLPKVSDFNIKNEVIESNSPNSNENTKDAQTPSPNPDNSKQPTEFYVSFNGKRYKVQNIILEI